MMQPRLVPPICVALVAFASGCAPASPRVAAPRPAAVDHDQDHDHDHGHGHEHEHEAPKSFAAALGTLRALGAELAEKMASGAGAEADGAVHEIGHLLEEARGFAKQEGLDAAAAAGLDELEECFGKVDEAFHAADEKVDPKQVLESVKDRLEAAFQKLAEVK